MSICEQLLDRLGMFSITPGLDAVRALANAAGDPQKDLRFIHIAGTNGKGSTGAMLESAFRHAGYRTGFYTSPHLIDLRERFRIDGKMVSVDDMDDAATEISSLAAGLTYSYFEFCTVLAARLFAAAKCDIVIWETGMGGRLDATNIVTPEVSIITGIALDHESYLGHDLAAIAAEKAGIIKPGVPVFTGNLPPEAAEVIKKYAAENNAPIVSAPPEIPEISSVDPVSHCTSFFYGGREISISLPGRMQRKNAMTAVNVLEYFAARDNIAVDRLLTGLAHTVWPGRMQFVRDDLIVDGGHNPDGVNALAASLKELLPDCKPTVIYGAFADKAVKDCLAILSTLAGRIFFVPIPAYGRPGAAPEKLQEMWREISTVPSECFAGVNQALKAAQQEKLTVVSGSLYLAGEVLRLCGGNGAAGDLA